MRGGRFDRRSFLKTAGGTGVAIGLAGCSGGAGSGGESTEADGGTESGGSGSSTSSLDVTTPEGNLNIMHFLHSIDEGFWEQRNIDLNA